MTAPYYQDDRVTLYHGDCREVTNWLAADVLVTDPPYGRGQAGIDATNRSVGRTYRGEKKGNGAAIVADEDTSLRDAALALWGKRPAFVFGDLRIPQPAGTGQVCIYCKPPDAGYRSTAGFRRDVEGIFLLHLPAGYGGRSSVIATAAPRIGGGGPCTRYGHPHAKPIDVMETLIGACPPGIIADPFAGAGSTLVAARNLGRPAVGVEVDERYCERTVKRLAQGVLVYDR
jgi:site-specific DNA-methyltransferase (adenine-specific)